MSFLTKLVLFSAVITSIPAISSEYPLEFADFFEEKIEPVSMVISGGQRNETVIAKINYDKFTLVNTKENTEIVTNFLKKKHLKKNVIKKVLNKLTSGVNANPGCIGSLELCVPMHVTGDVEYIFNYEDKELKLFVYPEVLDSMSSNMEYYSGYRESNAVINDSNLYVFSNNDNVNATWNNRTIVGAPIGYFNLETQLNTSDTTLDVFTAEYDAEFYDKRVILGYRDRHSYTEFNTTDILKQGSNYAGYGFTYGSSRNLSVSDPKAAQRIYIYVPQGGQLEVLSGDRILMTRSVSEGEYSIGYDELPSGSYTVNLVLRRGNQELFNEKRYIVNTSKYQLPVGEFDFSFGLNNLESFDENTKRTWLANSTLSNRFSESMILSSGVGLSNSSYYGQVGLQGYFDSDVNVEYLLSVFESGNNYQQGSLGYKGLSVNFKKVDNLDYKENLFNNLYGNENRTEYGVGWSGRVLGGTSFVNYSIYEYSQKSFDANKNNSLTLSWNRPAFGGELSLSTSLTEFGEENSVNTLISWSYQINDNVKQRSSMSFDNDGLAYTQYDLSKNYESDLLSSSITGGVKLAKDGFESELSGSTYGSDQHFNYDAYGYITSEGSHSISGTISGTQVWSKETRFLTSENSDTYVAIKPKWNGDRGKEYSEINYNVSKNNQVVYGDSFDEEDESFTTISVSNYTDLEVDLDGDFSDLKVIDPKLNVFTMPGSLYLLEPEIIKLDTQVLVLSDMFGQPIMSATCTGEGCGDVEPLSEDGVFRVSYQEGLPFKIISSKRLCVYDQEQFGNDFIKGYCLDGLEEIGTKDFVIKHKSEINLTNEKLIKFNDFIYIGKYESNIDSEQVLSRLKEVNLPLYTVQVGKDLYVYVHRKTEFTVAQTMILEDLEKYAIDNVVRSNNLFGFN